MGFDGVFKLFRATNSEKTQIGHSTSLDIAKRLLLCFNDCPTSLGLLRIVGKRVLRIIRHRGSHFWGSTGKILEGASPISMSSI